MIIKWIFDGGKLRIIKTDDSSIIAIYLALTFVCLRDNASDWRVNGSQFDSRFAREWSVTMHSLETWLELASFIGHHIYPVALVVVWISRKALGPLRLKTKMLSHQKYCVPKPHPLPWRGKLSKANSKEENFLHDAGLFEETQVGCFQTINPELFRSNQHNQRPRSGYGWARQKEKG